MKINAFTNENLTSYEKLFDFKNKKVLTVVGSSDQYFASLLYGAKTVDLYDINPEVIDYFFLKFEALKNLTYEEFKELFINSKFQNYAIYEKLRYYLPIKIKRKFDSLLFSRKDFIIYSSISNFPLNFSTDRIIPYLNELKYYELQKILLNTVYPNIIIEDLENITNINYDLLLTSNIFQWKTLTIEDYLKYLDSLNIPQIQAMYIYNSIQEKRFLFEQLDYITLPVNPSNYNNQLNDFVVLKRKL